MAWSDLCGMGTIEGKKIDLATLYGHGVDHDKRGKTGLPASASLSQMVGRAEGLKLKEGRGKGICFHVAHCTLGRDGAPNANTLINQFVREKTGASVCYEDMILPLQVQQGHIIVHQSVAPCTRCRSGYKKWAENLGGTIVVSADEGYDRSGDNPVFIFTPTGLVFYGN